MNRLVLYSYGDPVVAADAGSGTPEEWAAAAGELVRFRAQGGDRRADMVEAHAANGAEIEVSHDTLKRLPRSRSLARAWVQLLAPRPKARANPRPEFKPHLRRPMRTWRTAHVGEFTPAEFRRLARSILMRGTVLADYGWELERRAQLQGIDDRTLAKAQAAIIALHRDLVDSGQERLPAGPDVRAYWEGRDSWLNEVLA